MVLSMELDSAILEFYYKMLELQNVARVRERLYFLYPQHWLTFPRNMNLTRVLLYSPKTIKKIRQIVGEGKGYIVCGLPDKIDIQLSYHLDLPLFLGSPQKHQQLASKRGSRLFLQELQLPQPQGVCDMYDLPDLIEKLAFLITDNPGVSKWVFKIDDDTHSRGIAYLSLAKWPQMQLVSRQVLLVKGILEQGLEKRLQVVCISAYPSAVCFLGQLVHRGGVIEAYP